MLATIASSATEKTATLTYNANGHGTAPSSVTMKYTEATNAASAMGITWLYSHIEEAPNKDERLDIKIED